MHHEKIPSIEKLITIYLIIAKYLHTNNLLIISYQNRKIIVVFGCTTPSINLHLKAIKNATF